MFKVGIIGFGGGSALIPVMEKELVRPGRLHPSHFINDTVIANITPGALPVKLAALSGTRVGGARAAVLGAIAVALPGVAATVGLLALFRVLGAGAVAAVEAASLGITAFILYLLAHFVLKVLAPGGTVRTVALIIALIAFLATGAGRLVELLGEFLPLDIVGAVPELSALGLVVAALVLIAVFSLVQHLRSPRREPLSDHVDAGSGLGRRGIRAACAFLLVTAAGLGVAVVMPGDGGTGAFLGLVGLSTVTSFGGGEAYVGVADGFFVGNVVSSEVFYGQILPVANALPGPILVKIAAGVAFAAGTAGPMLAVAAFAVTVGVCSALAVVVLLGYDRARDSLLVRNISTYILPVICGLLASTAVSLLHSNARIAGEAGLPALPVVGASIGLAVLAPQMKRLRGVSDVVVIMLFGAATFGAVELAGVVLN
mgnify:CR=1 FL=1